MQLTTVLSLFAAAASAAPASGSGSACPASTRKFGIMALRSGTPSIHYASVGASQNKLALHLPDDKLDAQCTDGKVREDAVFYIKDEELYLYGKGDVVQQFLVDRSGMGQGVLQYFTKGPTAPGGRLEVKGWAVDGDGNLNFKGTGLQACQNTDDGPWYIWLQGVDEPASLKGCLPFVARTIINTDPVKCTYSNYVA